MFIPTMRFTLKMRFSLYICEYKYIFAAILPPGVESHHKGMIQSTLTVLLCVSQVIKNALIQHARMEMLSEIVF